MRRATAVDRRGAHAGQAVGGAVIRLFAIVCNLRRKKFAEVAVDDARDHVFA
jgi:hypothetical protein